MSSRQATLARWFGDGAMSRVDMAVFDIWASKGRNHKAIEIKVSRNDFLNER